MGYQVLARKWRPGSFQEMIGQQHVLRALTNALDHDRLHHAYLFTGTRGVGKTTVARIFSKCLNCEAGVSSKPCGQCASCLEIAEGRSVDLLEVDAASRTKIENTRELLENVQYVPTHSRYKIYLIDEVHMLSNHSFNALLKTLEEPPSHAKFLLATTDPQKLPATVLSRCLQFNLKNMVPDQIIEHLAYILEQESIRFDFDALGLLAYAAAGSMRDALSLTDQAIAFGAGELRETDVRSMLGTVDRSRVLNLVEAVVDNSPEKVLAGVDAIAQHAPDFAATLDELVSIFHQITVVQMVPDATDTILSEQQRIVELAALLTLDDTQLFYQFAVNGRRDLPIASDPRVGLEMTLLRMIAFRPAEIVISPESMSGKVNSGGVSSAKKSEPPVTPVVTKAPETDVCHAKNFECPTPAKNNEELLGSAPKVSEITVLEPLVCEQNQCIDSGDLNKKPLSSQNIKNNSNHVCNEVLSENIEGSLSPEGWPEFFECLNLVGVTQNIAMHCELVAVSGSYMRFILDEASAVLFQERQVSTLESAISEFLQRPVQLSIDIGTVSERTPQHRREQLAAEQQRQAEQAIHADLLLATLINEFDGELIEGSIRPL